jgi:hypothetical protein
LVIRALLGLGALYFVSSNQSMKPRKQKFISLKRVRNKFLRAAKRVLPAKKRFKFEARSTKSETNPKFKCSKSKTKAAWYNAFGFFSFWSFEFRSFEFVSNFDIRISDLLFLSLYANKHTNRVPVKVGRIK